MRLTGMLTWTLTGLSGEDPNTLLQVYGFGLVGDDKQWPTGPTLQPFGPYRGGQSGHIDVAIGPVFVSYKGS